MQLLGKEDEQLVKFIFHLSISVSGGLCKLCYNLDWMNSMGLILGQKIVNIYFIYETYVPCIGCIRGHVVTIGQRGIA